ncbi:MAG TPA: ABC transporter ATP-binding protein [Geminicoccaceae bacterium]|nr:ABC transporter ATP-binding protein [Geminicoccaceae bacterium]
MRQRSEGLVVDGLVKRYGAVTAVDDVSFTAAPGQFVSLLGPSGCGKTTTLRCIAGFERPDRGRISVDGEAVTDAATGAFTPPNRRNFGMVFQSYAIWPHMSVLDNVGYPLRVRRKYPRGVIRERVMDKLATVGLAGLEARYPAQLSGGQQQRVALARALIMEPKVLLFDEPLSNLDAKLRERMRFELVEIQSQLGIPAVYVTHDQAEAMVMSSRVIVMERGRVAQEGPPEQVYANPKSRFVAGFIGLSNFIRAEVRDRSADGTWLVESPLGRHPCTGEGAHGRGEGVLLAIRPEHIDLARQPFADGLGFAAELRARYFLGPYSEYFLSVGDQVLRAQAGASLAVEVGGRLYARVRPEHCRIVAGGTEDAASWDDGHGDA